MKEVKNQLEKKNFYLSIINSLEESTNLSNIQKKLCLSKQQLNYYLREMKKKGLVIKKGRGWYEVVKISKNSTKYGNLLSKDSSRGHAFVWSIKLPEKITNWEKRIEILKEKGINYNLVGILKTTPRIKVLGRKVWLCNDHLRIFDKSKQSYYGKTAKESKQLAFQELLEIIRVLENKLGLLFRPFTYNIKKEHYALIKNDLAIDQNRKGIIMRISDKKGEWLLIDDSMGEGGELETIGKKSYKTNIPLQNWWNDNKKYNFKVTPTFLMESMKNNTQCISGLAETQTMNSRNIIKHQKVLDEMLLTMKSIRDNLKK